MNSWSHGLRTANALKPCRITRYCHLQAVWQQLVSREFLQLYESRRLVQRQTTEHENCEEIHKPPRKTMVGCPIKDISVLLFLSHSTSCLVIFCHTGSVLSARLQLLLFIGRGPVVVLFLYFNFKAYAVLLLSLVL